MTSSAPPALPPLPSLASSLASLASLVSSPFCPPSLFLHDPSQSPVVIDAVLQLIHASRPATRAEPPDVGDLLPDVAHLDLAQVHSVKQALDRILAQFSGYELVTGNSALHWDAQSQGVKAWDRQSLEALRVVQHDAPARRKRTAPADAADPQDRKRRRLHRSEGSEDESAATTDNADEDGSGTDALETAPETAATPTWSLEWDRDRFRDYAAASTAVPEAQTLAPFRNSLDAFHDSLQSVFTFADEHRASPAPPDQAGLPRRRFLVLEHGELLSELAGAGKASGAARETGVGVTFASTVHRLGELVSSIR